MIALIAVPPLEVDSKLINISVSSTSTMPVCIANTPSILQSHSDGLIHACLHPLSTLSITGEKALPAACLVT
jgi:hypothetical protein